MKQTPKMDVSISPFGSLRVKTRTIRNKNTTRWTDSIIEHPYTLEFLHTKQDTSRNL
ncbi:hypothetical protein GIB67_008061 [Kingdonia uniflora]|uniref:Uncharacterized protein n=1 Tax=Kingdonia uniflora TaxID=39325 RepID=A0A7J7MN42_9MAGN|nr:hypothetical protein GIB67_008061 [Kingdonia uniflora]